jgi:signal transduction histidine kinase
MHSQAAGNGELQVAMVSHDLRVPINAILLGVDVLRRRQLGTTEDLIVNRVYLAAKRMAALVERALDSACLQLGVPIVLERERVNLEELCRDLLEEFRMAHPEREFGLVAEEGVTGMWDRLRIIELLSNLLANALTYGDRKTPIQVHVRRKGSAAQLQVVNEGPTIPRELWGPIFEPFRRAPTSSGHGVGLGLYIVAQIVEAHEGTVDVTSVKGTTRFTVNLPLGIP